MHSIAPDKLQFVKVVNWVCIKFGCENQLISLAWQRMCAESTSIARTLMPATVKAILSAWLATRST